MKGKQNGDDLFDRLSVSVFSLLFYSDVVIFLHQVLQMGAILLIIWQAGPEVD